MGNVQPLSQNIVIQDLYCIDVIIVDVQVLVNAVLVGNVGMQLVLVI